MLYEDTYNLLTGETMTVDERLEKLTERHEALTESVEILTKDVHDLLEIVRSHEQRLRNLEE
jgi:ribosomal protein S15P/S13E